MVISTQVLIMSPFNFELRCDHACFDRFSSIGVSSLFSSSPLFLQSDCDWLLMSLLIFSTVLPVIINVLLGFQILLWGYWILFLLLFVSFLFGISVNSVSSWFWLFWF